MWWRREKQEISEFLYQLLVSHAPSKGYARQVAERMAVPYPTLSKYWLGKRRFPAALVKPLFQATDHEPRIAEFFLLDGSEYRLARREDAEPPRDLARAVISLGQLAGTVCARYLEATADAGADARSDAGSNARADGGSDARSISRDHAGDLAASVRALIRCAEELRAAFDAAASPGDPPPTQDE